MRRVAIRTKFPVLATLAMLAIASPAWAGLYYSAESFAELPSQWRGFLLDHRGLRNIAVPPMKGNPASPARQRYLEQLAKLEQKDVPSADDLADLGAIHIRLGQFDKAIGVLRLAQRRHPEHFRIAANLGTAWQLQGDLVQAAQQLEQAARLAPEKLRQAEALHLKLVRQRLKQGRDQTDLDDLFGVRLVNDKGEYEPGKWSAKEKAKLLAGAVGLVQQLALWLPADGRLLWQLAELAQAHGDVGNAAAMFDGCVTAFNLPSAELRKHRQMVRAAADRQNGGDQAQHKQTHVSTLVFRSKRPLVNRPDSLPLPAIRAAGQNALPWDLLGDTILGGKGTQKFPRYLQDLAGKEVTITGFMQPLGDGLEVSSFLLVEHPIGCWYCEIPDATGMVHVELPAGQTVGRQRGPIRVTGRLSLNATDPEDFLYAIRAAQVAGID